MRIQLIFCVETDERCKSDQIYIKDTIERFFKYDNSMVKFSYVFMGGKGKYKTKSVVDKIEKNIKQFSLSDKSKKKTQNDSDEGSRSAVIYCFDCDDYDTDPAVSQFLEDVKQYCQDNQYEFVWFCKDIERVYVGKKIPDSEKKKRAERFKRKNEVSSVQKEALTAERYEQNRSNLLKVLSRFEVLQYKE